jgi:hypothetical protein
MDDGVQLFFCEFCNQSVPQKDIDSGAARKISDRVAGACCLPLLVPPASTTRTAGDPAGMLVLGVVCLVAIAASAFYLDWRLGSGLDRQNRQLLTQLSEVRSVADRVASLEGRMAETPRRSDVEALTTSMAQSTEPLRTLVRGLDERVRNQMADNQRALADARAQADQASLRTAQMEKSLDQFGKALDAIHADIKELRVAPPGVMGHNPAPQQPTERPAQDAGAGTQPQAPPAPNELPKNLQHYVQQLSDADAGTRWNAVDALAKSGDPRVVPHLIGVLKDSDAFVRRFCVGSLGELKAREALGPLVELLSDRELIVREAAQRSLRKISGHNLEFDADGPPARRAEQIQKWRDWLQAQGGK